MSLPDRLGACRIAGAILFAVPLAGCIQPLYAQRTPVATAATGSLPATDVAAALAAVEIVPISGRVGQKVRNELIFMMRGGGEAAPRTTRLVIQVTPSLQTPIVDPQSDLSLVDVASVDASFSLQRPVTAETLTSGTAMGRASFSHTRQRFATIRAQRDAEDRAARQVAQQIYARIASHFANPAAPSAVTASAVPRVNVPLPENTRR